LSEFCDEKMLLCSQLRTARLLNLGISLLQQGFHFELKLLLLLRTEFELIYDAAYLTNDISDTTGEYLCQLTH
tara:strand:+ start:419 stop:637 length:219 start_codon:yes stop_codon:yes gene_type:complete